MPSFITSPAKWLTTVRYISCHKPGIISPYLSTSPLKYSLLLPTSSCALQKKNVFSLWFWDAHRFLRSEHSPYCNRLLDESLFLSNQNYNNLKENTQICLIKSIKTKLKHFKHDIGLEMEKGFMKQNHKYIMYRNLMFGRYGILNLYHEKLHVKSGKSQYFL